MQRSSVGIPLVLVSLLLPAAARAEDPTIFHCIEGDTPGEVDDCTTCEIDGDALECDVAHGALVSGELTIISDFPNLGTPNYTVFGNRDDGTAVCCWIDDPDGIIEETRLLGGSMDDELRHEDVTGSFFLDGPVTAYAYGGGGNDTIIGSPSTDPAYYDTLFGETGEDTIYGRAGADRIDGGSGNDTLYGEGGDDVVRGGTGGDEIRGAAGNNTLCSGGSMAGMGSDQLIALSGANILWAPWALFAPTPVGSVMGSSSTCGSTSWGTSWVTGTCSHTLTTAPAACSAVW